MCHEIRIPLFLTALAVVTALLVLVILYRIIHGGFRSYPIVRGHFGAVRGLHILVEDDVQLRPLVAFYAVPYARPPVGPLRFQKPRARTSREPFVEGENGNITTSKPRSSSEDADEIVDCRVKRGPCPQKDFYFGSQRVTVDNWTEDCLHLNIWAPPSDCSNQRTDCGNYTVLFFLHGGQFQNGGNSYELYDGRFLAALGDMIVVVPNYRLGVFGFLWSPEAAAVIPSNLGLEDQVLALSWTVDNIGYFGGDPKKLVLAGHEAGAAALGFHLYSAPGNLWATIAARFIMLSGGTFRKFPATAENAAMDLARYIQCPEDLRRTETLGCLQRESASIVLAKAAMFWPVFHKSPIGRTPAELLTKQHENIGPQRKEILLGRTAHEGFQAMQETALEAAPGFPMTPFELAQDILQPIFGSERWVKTFGLDIDVHKITNVTFAVAEEAVTRALAVCPMLYQADKAFFAGNTVYGYVLSYRPSYGPWMHNVSGAIAFEDLHLAFGMPLRDGLSATELDRARSRNAISTLANFAKSGELLLENVSLPNYQEHGTFVQLGPDGISATSKLDGPLCDMMVDIFKS